MVDKAVAEQRIQNNQCAVCGCENSSDSILVEDARFGTILICEKHITRSTYYHKLE